MILKVVLISFLGWAGSSSYCSLEIKGKWKEEPNKQTENKRPVIRAFLYRLSASLLWGYCSQMGAQKLSKTWKNWFKKQSIFQRGNWWFRCPEDMITSPRNHMDYLVGIMVVPILGCLGCSGAVRIGTENYFQGGEIIHSPSRGLQKPDRPFKGGKQK